MGKRSSLGDKRPRDYWPTIDPDVIEPIMGFIEYHYFYEPCAGDLSLVDLLQSWGLAKCANASDIEPNHPLVDKKDALELTKEDLQWSDFIVTNPPYTWTILQPLLNHFISLKPTWLLLPADYMHNKRFGPYMKVCSDVVSVGRLYWQPNKVKGKENYAWYRFNESFEECETIFHGR